MEHEALTIPNHVLRMNEEYKQEQSRTIRFCMLKYKCVLIFTFMFLSFFQFLFILFKSVLGDESLSGNLNNLVSLLQKKNFTSEVWSAKL